MAEIFSPQAQWLWTVLLGVVLFFPVRRLIWVMQVRREERRSGGTVDPAHRLSLRRRAGVTAALLCFLFSVVYVEVLFSQLHGPAAP
jgi:hypothetical protein